MTKNFDKHYHRQPAKIEFPEQKMVCPNKQPECEVHCYHSKEHQKSQMCSQGICVITMTKERN